MSTDVSLDNNKKTQLVSTLSIALKNVDENRSEFTTNEANFGKIVVVTFKPTRTGEPENTVATGENSSFQAKLKQERKNLIQHLYSIIDTTREPTSNSDSNSDNCCVDNFQNDFADQWANSDDYDLNFCGRKASEFGLRKRAQYNSKTRKQIFEKFYPESHRFPLRAKQKKASRNGFYNKRKKELDLTRKAESVEKFKNIGLGATGGTDLETEYGFVYLYSSKYSKEMELMEKNENSKSSLEFTLCEENAPDDLQSDVLDFLLDLQDREITPEDYEYLLRLDESVPKKTIAEDRIASLETEIATELHVSETCGVCMENYSVGDTRKILPCKHVFHTCCVDTWLRHNSTRCPLDNKEV